VVNMEPAGYTHPPLVRGAELVTCLLLLVLECEWVEVAKLHSWLTEYWTSCDREMDPLSFAGFRGMLAAIQEAAGSDGRLKTQDPSEYLAASTTDQICHST